MGDQFDLAPLEKIFIDKPMPRYTLAGKGLYVGSRLPDVYAALQSAGLQKGDKFSDLGSGDGRLVCLAALFGARAQGFEADVELYRLSRERENSVREFYQGAQEHIEIKLACGDFLDYSVADEDFIFYYAGGAAHNQDEVYKKTY